MKKILLGILLTAFLAPLAGCIVYEGSGGYYYGRSYPERYYPERYYPERPYPYRYPYPYRRYYGY